MAVTSKLDITSISPFPCLYVLTLVHYIYLKVVDKIIKRIQKFILFGSTILLIMMVSFSTWCFVKMSEGLAVQIWRHVWFHHIRGKCSWFNNVLTMEQWSTYYFPVKGASWASYFGLMKIFPETSISLYFPWNVALIISKILRMLSTWAQYLR